MANSANSLAQTILYLRPQTPEGLEVLDILDNEPYRFEVAPPPEPVDIPLGGSPDLSPYNNALHDHGRASRESTPGLYPTSLRVLRIGFESIEKPSPRGFKFGSGPNSDVKVPYYGRQAMNAYFRIHYNFNSGALLVTALDIIKVGSVLLSAQQSLLIMAGMSIQCGGDFDFIVEFPDTSNCAEEHERSYQQYAATLGISDAQYMATPRGDLPPIGVEHRSVAILGKGYFGEVHKALNTKTAQLFAIKILSGGGEGEMKEVNIMSSLCHENIVKYKRAFRLPGGQTSIVIELAVNDLRTHLKARQNGKRRPYLSLTCIRSIGRQVLSGLVYLHNEGFMHRDLKPQNILVTKWDTGTDTPTIKLADFGLAGINSEHKTFCGTDGYIAPEVIEANKRAEELQKQKGKGMKTVPDNRRLTYTNAVDVWALGKILQEFVRDVPSQISLNRKKGPALRLIDRMMQDNPRRRPTAAECLKDPWMATIDNSNSPLAQKRGRSPGSSPTSSAEQPLRKVMRRAFADSMSTDEGSTIRIMNAIWSHESSHQNGSAQVQRGAPAPSDVEMKDRSSVEEGQMQHEHHQPPQLTIQPGEDGRLLLTSHSHKDALMLDSLVSRNKCIAPAILADNAGPQGASSMQDVARRLLAALQAEGYGKNVAVSGNSTDVGVVREKLSRLNISNIQVRQHSECLIMLGLEYDGEGWTSSFWNETQSSVNHSIGPQSTSLVERNDAAAAGNNSRPRSYLEVMFSQVPLPSSFDQPWYHQPEPVTHPDQFPLPAITLDDGQVPRPLHASSSLDRGNTSNISSLPQSGLGSNSSWASTVGKGVTYPRHYDDPVAELSF
ncbi:hypothetical protein MMC30_002906 [Trapelia coarctata]|nr:hypothetical protein [Trapelia coarctata]